MDLDPFISGFRDAIASQLSSLQEQLVQHFALELGRSIVHLEATSPIRQPSNSTISSVYKSCADASPLLPRPSVPVPAHNGRDTLLAVEGPKSGVDTPSPQDSLELVRPSSLGPSAREAPHIRPSGPSMASWNDSAPHRQLSCASSADGVIVRPALKKPISVRFVDVEEMEETESSVETAPKGIQLTMSTPKPLLCEADEQEDKVLELTLNEQRWADLVSEALDKREVLQKLNATWSAHKYFDEPLVLRSHWKINDQRVVMRPKGGLGWMGSMTDHTQIGDMLLGKVILDRLVGHPHGPRRIVWGVIGTIFVGYDALVIPLQIFELAPDHPFTRFLAVMQMVTFIWWLLDLFMSAFFGYQDVEGLIEMRFKRVSKHYVRRQFPFDITLILIDVLLLVMDSRMIKGEVTFLQAGSRGMRLVRLLRLLRLVRLLRISKSGEAFRIIASMARSTFTVLAMKLVTQLLGILLVSHYIACCWLAMADLRESMVLQHDVITWVYAFGLEEEPFGTRYVIALHWALTQFSPATNNIAPACAEERTFAICVVLFALIIFSSFISSVTNNVNQARSVLNDFRVQEASMRQFMFERGISTDLFSRTQQFFKQNYAKRKFRMLENDVKFFQELPESFRVRFHAECYMPVLRSNVIFKHLCEVDESLLVRVCHTTMKESTFFTGADIFIDGNDAHSVYFIQSGKLIYRSVFTNEPEAVTQKDWMSEIALWIQWVYRGQLCAASMCEVTIIDELAFMDLITRQHGLCVDSMRRFAIFFLAHAQDLQDNQQPLTDMPMDTKKIQALVTQALRLSSLSITSKHGVGLFGSINSSLRGRAAGPGQTLGQRARGSINVPYLQGVSY